MPTAANLNLYRVWNSCVRWHCDDEPLFGECEEAKLIVSVGFGSSTPFKWKGKSCSDNEACLCCLGHGDIIVMDGQCQDKFFHCTDPGLEQERIDVTFIWIKQHVPSCSFLMAGVACCLPTCARLVHMERREGEPACLAHSLACTRLGSLRCASRWPRLLGGGRWGHYLCDLWGDYCAAHKIAAYLCGTNGSFVDGKPYLLALTRQPSLHGCACMVYWAKRALWRICRQKHCETSFSPSRVFLFSRVLSWGISGLGGLSTLGQLTHPNKLLLKFPMSGAGSRGFSLGGWC